MQFWIEYGLIGCLFFVSIVILSFIKAIQAQQQRHTAILKGMGFAAMMGIMSIMIHSSTDFNLFTLLCAFACIAHSMEHQEHETKRRKKTK